MPHPNTSDYQPLFGETRRRDKIINVTVATITGSFVLLTVLLSLINGLFMQGDKCLLIFKESSFCVYPLDVLFSLVILLLLVPQVFVILWYRRGELEPKFRRMIFYNAVVTVLLCCIAIVYFFQFEFFATQPSCPKNNYTAKATSP